MTTNAPATDAFIDELRADPRFATCAEPIRTGLMEIDRKADDDSRPDSPDHAEFFAGMEYIFSNRSRPLVERFEKLREFSGLEGSPVVVNLKEFTGW
jgi:hypothetical protein